jgi:hypothetical protein
MHFVGFGWCLFQFLACLQWKIAEIRQFASACLSVRLHVTTQELLIKFSYEF